MSRDTNFYYSFLVLTPARRRAIVAVWDFCRVVDDSVDQATTPDALARAGEVLDGWRAELGRCFDGSRPKTPEGRRLQGFVSQFGLPREPFESLIDGVAMDLGHRRYQTFEELCEYCRHVASTVGLICLEIFGYTNPGARDYAVWLGIALQLTNIIRDVPGDLARGRLYLPLDDLERFGCTEADLRAGRLTPEVRALLAFECERARACYARARAALPREDVRRLVAAEIMGAIYQAILTRIERRGYDVFSEVVRVSRPRRALIAGVTWARAVVIG